MLIYAIKSAVRATVPARGVSHGLGLLFWGTEFLFSVGASSKPNAQHWGDNVAQQGRGYSKAKCIINPQQGLD